MARLAAMALLRHISVSMLLLKLSLAENKVSIVISLGKDALR